MTLPFTLLLLLLPLLGQSPAPSLDDLPACTLQNKTYTCTRSSLDQALARTRTVALVSQPANHASDAALASVARSLGKTVVPASDQPDLTLRLTPIAQVGVTLGTGTADLAMLNVFLSTPGDPTHKLLWSETYTGDPDTPWPSTAYALARQFKNHLAKR